MAGAILQIHEMIDALNDFLDDPTETRFFIGGMVGSQPFKYTIDSILSRAEFKDICVIEGCQDYIGMTKASPCNNHFYYEDLIVETKIPAKGFGSSFDDGFMVWNPMKLDYKYHVDFMDVGRFDYIVINDAQLIPTDVLEALKKFYPGKMIIIFDPYEVGAESFIGYPSIIDSLSKQSAITAFARRVYNVPTTSIDKSVRCSVREMKISRRSFGKKDDNQYVTNDKWLAEALWDKQMDTQLRKGQRLWVTDKRLLRLKDPEGKTFTITKNSMLVVETVPVYGKKIRLRVWNAKFTFESEVSYKNDSRIGCINVRPANIIMVNEVRYHKFPNMVLLAGNDVTPREKYLLLKNTHNLVIGT